MQRNYKKALVTGATGGLCSLICRRLAERRVELVVCDINADGLEALAGSLGNKTSIDTVVTDVSDHEGLEKILREVVAKHPDIDLLVLGAGIDKPQRAEEFDWRLGKLHFDVNTTSVYVFLSIFVPHFIKVGGGHVTTLVSMGALLGFPYEHAYNGSKAATRMIIDGYRAELEDRNITFTSVLPGFIKTEMAVNNAWQVKKFMTPEDAVQKIIDSTYKQDAYLVFPKSTQLLAGVLGLLPVKLRNRLLMKEMKKKF